jgi:hypothetical protein
MPSHRSSTWALVLVLFVATGCQSAASSTGTIVSQEPTTVPGAPSTAGAVEERVVGAGFAVIHERGGPSAQASTTQPEATHLVITQIAAGAATETPRRGPIPPMHVVEAALSPALVDVVNPWGSWSYSAAEPIAAWVVMSEATGADGEYWAIGVVDDVSGRPLSVQVWLPGA